MYLPGMRPWTTYLVLVIFLALGGSLRQLDGSFRVGACVLAAEAAPAPQDGGASAIRHIDLVHLSHTDVGFTDHPIVCRELQKRYLDIAVDTVLATRDRPESARFCWTAESALGVDDWWRSATPRRARTSSQRSTRANWPWRPWP